MAVDIIESFKLATNLPIDERYIVNNINDVSSLWYDGMMLYDTSMNRLRIVTDVLNDKIDIVTYGDGYLLESSLGYGIKYDNLVSKYVVDASEFATVTLLDYEISEVKKDIAPVSFIDLCTDANQSLTTSFTDILWQVERTKDDADYTHSANSAEVIFKTDGRYLVFLKTTCFQTSNTRSEQRQILQLDDGTGYVDLLGTLGYNYSRTAVADSDSATSIILVDVSAGFKLKGQAMINAGSATLSLMAGASSLSITNMLGNKGIDGTDGSIGTNGVDASLAIKVNNVLQSQGQSAILNFTGYNIDSSFNAGVTNIDFSFGDLSSLGVNRSTSQTITTAWTNIVFDTTDIQKGTAVNLDGTNKDRIYFNENGTYLIDLTPIVTNTGSTTRISTQALMNGTTLILGSDHNILNYQNEDHGLQTSFIVDASSGQYMVFQLMRDQTNGTLQPGCNATVVRLNGPKGSDGVDGTDGTDGVDGSNGIQGPPGPAGAGSSIILEKDSANAFTVNTLNFTGGVTLTQNSSTGNINVTTPDTVDVSIGLLDEGTSIGKYKNLDFAGNIVTASEKDTNTGLVTINQVFGSELQYAEVDTESSTTSTTPVDKLTLTTSNLPLGRYRATVRWMWRHQSASSDGRFDMTLGGTPLGVNSTSSMEPKDINAWHPATRSHYRSLSGVNTFVFRYWSESSTTRVSDVSIELIRVI